MPRRTGLGRGLDALISGAESATPSGGSARFPWSASRPNPRQPRTNSTRRIGRAGRFDREHGVIQPLILTYGEADDQYVLIAGERRLLAARQVGLEAVPAIVREAGEQQRLELALIENVQRTTLAPWKPPSLRQLWKIRPFT